MSLVSVVMPVYNVEAYVRSAVESILRQTWQDFELLVVDDGSTDGTLRMVERIRDPRIRLIAAAHVGFQGTLERAVREARGRWIARMDGDDLSHPRRLERQMEALKEHAHCKFVSSVYGILTPNGKLLLPSAVFEWRDISPRDFTVCSWSFADPGVVFDRECALAVGLYDRNLENEKTLYYRMLQAGMGGGIVGQPLYFWRYRWGSFTKSNFEHRATEYLEVRRRYDPDAYPIAVRRAANSSPQEAKARLLRRAVTYYVLAGDWRAAWGLAFDQLVRYSWRGGVGQAVLKGILRGTRLRLCGTARARYDYYPGGRYHILPHAEEIPPAGQGSRR